MSLYFSAKSDIEITAALIISSIAPRYDCGGSTLAFLTIAGAPSSSINDTTASPIPKFVIISAVSKSGFAL